MSVRDIPRHKLKEVAKYLDGFPPSSHDNLDEDEGEEQYWGLFVRELKRIPNMSKKFSYTNVQIVEFGEEDLKGRSPSLKLLYDLKEKKLELESFVYCLQKINCRGALNVFRDASKRATILDIVCTLHSLNNFVVGCMSSLRFVS